MARELQPYQLIERSIIKKYRKNIWNPFIEAVQNYHLVNEGDSILVVVDNTAKSMLLAKLMQQLNRVSDVKFDLGFKVLPNAIDNARLLNIPKCEIEYNKITTTTCFDDVVSTLLNNMMYSSKIEAPLPMKRDGEDIVIAPLFCVKTEFVNAFVRYNNLSFDADIEPSEDMKKTLALLDDIRKNDKDVERSIFKSVHSVCLDTMLGYEENGENHTFLEKY